jgi:hypothetical protein
MYKYLMEELVCPRCAAVTANVPSVAVCSNCGYDFHSTAGRIRSRAKRHGWLIFMLLFAVVTLSSSVVFSVIAAGFVLLAIGFSTTEKMRQSLSFSDSARTHVIGPLFPKPSLPGKWEPIAQVPRPRDVHASSAMKIMTLLGAAGYLAGITVVIDALWKRPAVISDNSFVLTWLVLFSFIFIGAGAIRGFLIDREVLREGDLTPGVLTDWTKGRRGISIRYQFWTPSGQRFEGGGTVNSTRDLAGSDGIFPVFYLSHKPKRNVALCCTSLRITR